MNTQTLDLIKIRLISFGYQVLALVIATLLGVLFSDDFRNIVVQNAGDGVVGTMIVLVFDALIKHIRNVQVIGKWAQLGSREYSRPTLI